jgi:hypothetical protein
VNLSAISQLLKNKSKKYNQEREINSELTFSITNNYPDHSYETINYIIVGSKNNQNFYSLNAMNLNKKDIA